mmetsp:Transcript_48713/g.74106  ORF Transcript_48713/g.74106 Transcript_48713/m.74106 type:complete len:480 (-) Transcript_48713:185-1624(-)
MVRNIKAWEMPICDKDLEELNADTTLEGTSGVYLLTSASGEGTAVFKPADEEYLPEEVAGWGLVSGEGVRREKAAFLLSEALGGFPGVPFTGIFEVNSKVGCAQRFVPQCTDMSDLGPNGLAVSEVQKVAMMDILTFNMDRHEGNILMQEATKELIPIDHAQCLPEVVSSKGANTDMLGSLYFAWQTWPQAKVAWTDEAKSIISSISPDSLALRINEQMGAFPLSSTALTALKVGAHVLKTCVALDLSASEIAELIRDKLAALLDASSLVANASAAVAWEKTLLKDLNTRIRTLFNAEISDSETVISAVSTEEDEGVVEQTDKAASIELTESEKQLAVEAGAPLYEDEDDEATVTKEVEECILQNMFARAGSVAEGSLSLCKHALSDALEFVLTRCPEVLLLARCPQASEGATSPCAALLSSPCAMALRQRMQRSVRAGGNAWPQRRRAQFSSSTLHASPRGVLGEGGGAKLTEAVGSS